MHRPTWKTVSTLVTTIAIVGCQDSTILAPVVAPVAPTTIENAPAGMFVPNYSTTGASAGWSFGSNDNDEYAVSFTVPASGGVFWIGLNIVRFPANSICDSNSSYGAGTWDDSCTPAKGDTKIKATVRVTSSRIWIDFDQHIRFVPSNNPDNWVTLTMWNPGTIGAKNLSAFNIWYTSGLGQKGVDESVSDGTLASYVGWGFVQRRIKHFSGYSVATGRACTPSPDDPDCVDDGRGIGGGDGE